MTQPGVSANTAPAFLEKDFYLREFRGRNLAIAATAADLRDASSLSPLLDELAANATGAVVISTERSALEPLVGDRIVSAATPRIEAVTWRRLREAPRAGILVGGSLAFAPAVCDVALRLRCSKLVWTDREGGLARPGGERLSFVHREELDELIAAPGAIVERRLGILREVRTLLGHGLPAVNLCGIEGLAEELFTYAGSGTLFTRDRYVVVRPLGLDDFDAADDLISRGVEEGWLARRSAEAVDEVLASGFGAFVEDVHLAGIGALLVDPATRTGEIASMYTLTRFLGEGIGGHLIAHARLLAREQGLSYLYACTTSPRVVAFFERHGLCVVPQEAVPVTKWRGYDVARRPSVICLRENLATGSRERD